MMADKQATVYVVDIGATTGGRHSGRIESDYTLLLVGFTGWTLDHGMRYVWEKIALTLSANRVGLLVGVIGFRADKTSHHLDLGKEALEDYENIWVMRPLELIKMNHLKELQRDIIPSHTNDGDAISAIVVAIDMIKQATILKTGKLGKFKRKIVLLTDGRGTMNGEDLDDIAAQMNEVEIELVVIGIDFDNEEYGFKEEDKSKTKRDNEQTLKDLTEKCKGKFATAAEAIDDIATPTLKQTRPYSMYTGKLSLGDWRKYEETALYIDVKRYFKTKQMKPVSASNFVPQSTNGAASGQSSYTLAGDTNMADAPPSNGDLLAVRNARHYQVNSTTEGAVEGKLEVDRDELAKGYEYGRTAVHISESDENVTKLETFSEFTIIGFIPWDKYERYLNMGESCITIAETINEKARMALSSLIHSLYELESYAVARFIAKDGKDPVILLLAPLIERDIEALIDVPLPFAEDVRMYRFPPLDRVITTSGATVKTHRYLPNEDLVNAMSEYVDSMDLSKFGKDEDGDPTEYMPIEETFSPMVHRINQGIRRRATHPNDPVTPPADILVKYANPPAELVKKTAPELKALQKAADVKKVPPKVKGRGKRVVTKPLSDLDVDALLRSEKRQKISKDNAVAEFKQMMREPDLPTVRDAAKQMGEIAREIIKEYTTGGHNYERAMEILKVMRYEMIECEEPESYNNFIRGLKKDLLNGSLGGDSKALWFKIRKANHGLITNEQAPSSEVSVSEANEFLSSVGMGLPSRCK